MIPSKIRAVLLCLALVACGDKRPKTPPVDEVLPNLPLPPEPTLVERRGGSDALQITVRSPASVEQVSAYYRKVLTSGNWKLVSDAKDSEGATVLLAEQKGPPLWVRIKDAGQGGGTLVQIAGAVVSKADSGAGKRAS
jgi:hypothetical protein